MAAAFGTPMMFDCQQQHVKNFSGSIVVGMVWRSNFVEIRFHFLYITLRECGFCSRLSSTVCLPIAQYSL